MKKLEKTLNIVSALLILWLLISFIDIVSHNMTTHVYQWWNAFTWLF